MREGWEYKKLGEVCETSSGGTPSKSHMEYYEGGKIPWLRSGEVSQGLIYNTELYITELGLEKSSAKIFPIDTVVIAMYGATVGQVGLLKRKISTNQAICGIFPNSTIFPMFLLYCLKSKKTIFLKDAVGGAQPNISQNIIKNTIIPVPPLSEQQRIVSELDLLSSIIEKKKAQLKEYDQLAQSIFYDMFGDPVENPKGWEVKPFELLCTDMTKGPFGSDIKKDLYVPRSDNTYKVYIQINAIQKDETLGECYISKEYFDKKMFRFEVKPYDYIITCDGTLGKYIRLSESMERGIISSSLLKLTINDLIASKYFEFLWDIYILDSLKNQARNAALIHLPSAKVIGKELVPLPPLPLQQSFASKIEAIERQKALIQQSITEAETLFNSRMDYWFS